MIWDTPGGRYMLFGDQLVRLTGRHEEVVARAISCDGASAELRGSGQVVFVPPTVPGLSVVSKVETLVPTVTRADSDLVTMGENVTSVSLECTCGAPPGALFSGHAAFCPQFKS